MSVKVYSKRSVWRIHTKILHNFVCDYFLYFFLIMHFYKESKNITSKDYLFSYVDNSQL